MKVNNRSSKMEQRKHSVLYEVPNAETRKAIEEARKRIGVTKFKNVDELFKKLGL